MEVSLVLEFVYISDCFLVITFKSIETFFVKLYIDISNGWLGSSKSLCFAFKISPFSASEVLVTLRLGIQDLSGLLLRSSSHACGSRRKITSLSIWVEMEPVCVRMIIVTRRELSVLEEF